MPATTPISTPRLALAPALSASVTFAVRGDGGARLDRAASDTASGVFEVEHR